MNRTARRWMGHALTVIAAATLLTGCRDDAPLGPKHAFGQRSQLGTLSATGAGGAAVNLGSCDSLSAPEGSTLNLRVYATGAQIYRWTGTTWTFVAPSAVLFADAGGMGTVGTHYAGPTWQSNSGSKVVGTVLKRCTPDASAIPWLSLGIVSVEGPGVFEGTTLIQRVNTVGGLAPSAPGTTTNELKSVPYTAEYLFYRAP